MDEDVPPNPSIEQKTGDSGDGGAAEDKDPSKKNHNFDVADLDDVTISFLNKRAQEYLQENPFWWPVMAEAAALTDYKNNLE